MSYGLYKLQDFYWVRKFVSSFCLSFAYIEMSTCVAHWLIYDSSSMYVCIINIIVIDSAVNYLIMFLQQCAFVNVIVTVLCKIISHLF